MCVSRQCAFNSINKRTLLTRKEFRRSQRSACKPRNILGHFGASHQHKRRRMYTNSCSMPIHVHTKHTHTHRPIEMHIQMQCNFLARSCTFASAVAWWWRNTCELCNKWNIRASCGWHHHHRQCERFVMLCCMHWQSADNYTWLSVYLECVFKVIILCIRVVQIIENLQVECMCWTLFKFILNTSLKSLVYYILYLFYTKIITRYLKNMFTNKNREYLWKKPKLSLILPILASSIDFYFDNQSLKL